MPTYELKVKRTVQLYEACYVKVEANNPKEARQLALHTPSNQLVSVCTECPPIQIDEAYCIRRVFTKGDQAEYVGHGGNYCPVCDSKDLILSIYETKEIVGCQDCLSTWKNVYSLSGFEEVKEPTNGQT